MMPRRAGEASSVSFLTGPGRPRARQGGFTLMELLIVAFLLGLGATMAGISFSRFMSQSEESKWADLTLRELRGERNRAMFSGRKTVARVDFADGALGRLSEEVQESGAAGEGAMLPAGTDDPAAGTEEGPVFEPVLVLPERFRFAPEAELLPAEQAAMDESARKGEDEDADALRVAFYPDGSSTAAAFRLLTPSGLSYRLRVSGLTGRITMERPGS